ncbi:hypothetical protein AVEN_247977-1 [Araneus ventricosus]|uniref:Uncharacterized protein n=1 Tax=Araneus ventricosus TaxID=182803 RepID=A0A4Y2CI70_ARAVE|nr:hypothetical protein AVEN_247977-1 [Araneus ventricosus]
MLWKVLALPARLQEKYNAVYSKICTSGWVESCSCWPFHTVKEAKTQKRQVKIWSDSLSKLNAMESTGTSPISREMPWNHVEKQVLSKIWHVRIHSHNTAYQATFRGLLVSVKEARIQRGQVKIWSENRSKLNAMENTGNTSPIPREVQIRLLQNLHIWLGWILLILAFS